MTLTHHPRGGQRLRPKPRHEETGPEIRADPQDPSDQESKRGHRDQHRPEEGIRLGTILFQISGTQGNKPGVERVAGEEVRGDQRGRLPGTKGPRPPATYRTRQPAPTPGGSPGPSRRHHRRTSRRRPSPSVPSHSASGRSLARQPAALASRSTQCSSASDGRRISPWSAWNALQHFQRALDHGLRGELETDTGLALAAHVQPPGAIPQQGDQGRRPGRRDRRRGRGAP